jgi:hypothetical protein
MTEEMRRQIESSGIERLRWILEVMEQHPSDDGLLDEEYAARQRLERLEKLAGRDGFEPSSRGSQGALSPRS